jgi:molybdopterin-guanine dinucleotide biosynthesis protein B
MTQPIQNSATPVHIIGQPGAGKTTLVADLVRHFTEKGFAAGTLKHSSHSHELDKPGKDSHAHRIAGACPAAMVTASMAAIYLPASDQTRPHALINTYFKHLDLVLIEGWIAGPWPKVEIWRRETNRPPVFMDMDVSGVRAVATSSVLDEDALNAAREQKMFLLSLEDLAGIAHCVMTLSGRTCR